MHFKYKKMRKSNYLGSITGSIYFYDRFDYNRFKFRLDQLNRIDSKFKSTWQIDLKIDQPSRSVKLSFFYVEQIILGKVKFWAHWTDWADSKVYQKNYILDIIISKKGRSYL